MDVEDVLFEHEGEEDGEPPEDGEHGKRESLRRSQAEDEIGHVKQRKGKHLDRHGKVPGEIDHTCEKKTFRHLTHVPLVMHFPTVISRNYKG